MADQALAQLDLILESSDDDDDVLDNLLVQAAAAWLKLMNQGLFMKNK